MSAMKENVSLIGYWKIKELIIIFVVIIVLFHLPRDDDYNDGDGRNW